MLWAAAGCSSGVTEALVTLDGEAGLPALRSAKIQIELTDPARSVMQTVPTTLPQTVLLVLPPVATTLKVTLDAETTSGIPLVATASTTTRPHERVELSLLLSRNAVADLSAGDSGDLGGVLGWRQVATTGPAP